MRQENRPVKRIRALRSGGKASQVGEQVVDAVGRGVPRTHEARTARADEGIEAPAERAQAGFAGCRHVDEDAVGLDRVEQADAVDRGAGGLDQGARLRDRRRQPDVSHRYSGAVARRAGGGR